MMEEITHPPPHNPEAEQSLLGSILIDEEMLVDVCGIFTDSGKEFFREAHRLIFKAMLHLYDKGEHIDLVTVSEVLSEKNQLETVGGYGYLADLMASVPSSENALAYARIVADKAGIRKLIQISNEITEACYSSGKALPEILSQAEASLFSIGGSNGTANSAPYTPISESIKRSIATIEEMRMSKKSITGVPSFYYDLDKLTSGFQPADLVIVAGRPSMGKTAFALNMASNMVSKGDSAVGFFSLEMSMDQLSMRLLCMEGRVDSHAIRSGTASSEALGKLYGVAGFLSDAPLYVNDTGSLSTFELRAKAKRMHTDKGISIIMVDYLQLMRSRDKSRDGREQEISDISRSLKALAKELSIPVIALSQLNRKVEERHNKRPQMSDLRESGAIEQDADIILFLYRDEVYNSATQEPGVAEINIAKQRNGPIGTVKLQYDSTYTRFDNMMNFRRPK